jgi:hypothetical protein
MVCGQLYRMCTGDAYRSLLALRHRMGANVRGANVQRSTHNASPDIEKLSDQVREFQLLFKTKCIRGSILSRCWIAKFGQYHLSSIRSHKPTTSTTSIPSTNMRFDIFIIPVLLAMASAHPTEGPAEGDLFAGRVPLVSRSVVSVHKATSSN